MEVGSIAKYIPFTDEQKQRANSVDLEEFLLRRGERLLPSGRDKRLDSDHSVTIRGCEWFDHDLRLGGHSISFAQRHYGLTYPEAVKMLLNGEDGAGYPLAGKGNNGPAKPFALPERSPNMRRVFAYLMERRGIERSVLQHFAHARVIYEERKYHNAVFVGLDEHGVARHAHMRSTNFGGKPFRMNVEGSRPQYSFHHIGTDEELFVFESPIDLLSYITLHPESWQEHSYVSLCGTGGQAMHWLLDQCPNIHTVHLALDNDKAGRGAAQRLSGELKQKVSSTDVLSPQRKDWNEDLMNDPRRVDY